MDLWTIVFISFSSVYKDTGRGADDDTSQDRYSTDLKLSVYNHVSMLRARTGPIVCRCAMDR